MIIDANTGAVLHNDDGDERRHPASLTKMMTLYLTFETVELGPAFVCQPREGQPGGRVRATLEFGPRAW